MLGSFASPVLAQARKDGKAPAAPTAAAPTAPPAAAEAAKGGNQQVWVKLCEQATFKTDGRDERKAVCITHHERLDANTGLVLVSAAVRQIEGQANPMLMVMLPLGMALVPGVQLKIDQDGQILKLPFVVCHPAGCTAETEATPELLTRLKGGKELMVATLSLSGQALGFPVPLTGLGTTLDGAAVDPQKYADARRNLLDVIKRRQAELGKGAAPAQGR